MLVYEVPPSTTHLLSHTEVRIKMAHIHTILELQYVLHEGTFLSTLSGSIDRRDLSKVMSPGTRVT